MHNNGDSILTITNEDAILATTNFSEKYIRNKKYGKFKIKKNCILVFSWTEDKFRNVEVPSVRSITALGTILRNPSPEILRGL